MKTAKQYLFDVMGCEPVMSRMDYNDALEAVQAAIDDAGTLREQVRQGLADYFGDVLPEPPPLPASTPPIRLGGRQAVYGPALSPEQHQVFPPACPHCLQRRDQCICPPREEPPF